MKKAFVMIAAAVALAGCSSVNRVAYYPNGQIQESYSENEFIGTLRDLGLGSIWTWTFRMPCYPHGDFYWHTAPPVPRD